MDFSSRSVAELAFKKAIVFEGRLYKYIATKTNKEKNNVVVAVCLIKRLHVETIRSKRYKTSTLTNWLKKQCNV